MVDLRVLVANEPRAYRDAIAAALQELRPNVAVIPVEPHGLDGEIARLDPHLVVCSRLTEAVQARPLAWVMLYPDGEPWAVMSIAGQHMLVTGIEFQALLAVLDHTAQLAQLS